MSEENYISEKSILRDVKLGKGVKVWHYSNLYECEIGDHTQIGSHSEIKSKAKIGKYCRFQSYVFIPEETQVGDYVFLGPRVTITNDKHPSAVKAISKKWKVAPVIIENHAVIGASVTILPGIRVGEKCVIAAGSCVTKDVPAYAIVMGHPAKVVGDIRNESHREQYQELLEAAAKESS